MKSTYVVRVWIVSAYGSRLRNVQVCATRSDAQAYIRTRKDPTRYEIERVPLYQPTQREPKK